MSERKILATSAQETKNLGQSLAADLRPGDVVALRGELGAGKTTFTQGIARGLQMEDAATSPTFVLINEYETEPPLLHLDAYRLGGQCYDAMRDAGVLDFFDRADAVKVVEWPELVEGFLPKPRFDISFKYSDDASREISITENS